MDKKFIITRDTSVRDSLLLAGFVQIPCSDGAFYFINDEKRMINFSKKNKLKDKYVLTNILTF